MSTDGMRDVEVPIYGTVVVQDGEVHAVKEYAPREYRCYCLDGKHWNRTAGVKPHKVLVQTFELAWEVNK